MRPDLRRPHGAGKVAIGPGGNDSVNRLNPARRSPLPRSSFDWGLSLRPAPCDHDKGKRERAGDCG